jgi:hypothetical protein
MVEAVGGAHGEVEAAVAVEVGDGAGGERVRLRVLPQRGEARAVGAAEVDAGAVAGDVGEAAVAREQAVGRVAQGDRGGLAGRGSSRVAVTW